MCNSKSCIGCRQSWLLLFWYSLTLSYVSNSEERSKQKLGTISSILRKVIEYFPIWLWFLLSHCTSIGLASIWLWPGGIVLGDRTGQKHRSKVEAQEQNKNKAEAKKKEAIQEKQTQIAQQEAKKFEEYHFFFVCGTDVWKRMFWLKTWL